MLLIVFIACALANIGYYLLRASPPLCFFPGKFHSWLTSHTHHNSSLQLQYVTYALTWGLVGYHVVSHHNGRLARVLLFRAVFVFVSFLLFLWFLQNWLPLNQKSCLGSLSLMLKLLWDNCHPHVTSQKWKNIKIKIQPHVQFGVDKSNGVNKSHLNIIMLFQGPSKALKCVHISRPNQFSGILLNLLFYFIQNF